MSLLEWISHCSWEKGLPTASKPRVTKNKVDHAKKAEAEDVRNVLPEIGYQPTMVDPSILEGSALLSFVKGHPLSDTHSTRCLSQAKALVPNFTGPTLPC
jgi:hypothetical protein